MEMVISTQYVQGNKLLVTFRPCRSCKQTHELTVDEFAFENYMDGVKSLQEAFPELTAAEHELFLTAMDGACYEKMADQEEY
jgi:hypothetical protein